MDVLLHCGAHRAATTSFQQFLHANAASLRGHSIDIWTPPKTRDGMLHGLTQAPIMPRRAARPAGRVKLHLDQARRAGAAVVLVSDAALLGSLHDCLRTGLLYADAGERMARAHGGFAPVRRIVIQIRSLEVWWASVMAWRIPRGGQLPQASQLARIAEVDRSWRHVITDLACACPETEIVVAPFERFASQPERIFEVLTGSLFPPKARGMQAWARRAPDLDRLRATLTERGEDAQALPQGNGRWQPFSPKQVAALREAYADDLLWLRSGADGLAILTQDEAPAFDRNTGKAQADERGHTDDRADTADMA